MMMKFTQLQYDDDTNKRNEKELFVMVGCVLAFGACPFVRTDIAGSVLYLSNGNQISVVETVEQIAAIIKKG